MPTLERSTSLPVSAETAYAWHERPGAFDRLVPPWENVKVEEHEGIEEDALARLRVRVGPLSLRWHARHEDVRPGRSFSDVQTKGPFASWHHTHHFEDVDNGSELTDQIEYELPGGPLGSVAEGSIRKRLERQFDYRHRITRQDLADHARYGDTAMQIAVTGTNGFIGSHLVPYLRAGGHTVLRLVRSKSEAEAHDALYWNHNEGELSAHELEGFDALVHLAGESVVAPRWGRHKKMRIYDSRVHGTGFLAESLAELDDPPVFISASGIGIYPETETDEWIDEDSQLADAGFLAAVCRDWESAADPLRERGVRTVYLRTGAVLSPDSGALAMLAPLFRIGLGGTYGEAGRYLSWIALDDVLRMYYHVLTSEIEGAVNCVAPNPVTTATFARDLAHVLQRPHFMRIPDSVLQLGASEALRETALKSYRIRPSRIREDGFEFAYPELRPALHHRLGR